jgi:chromosome segregation ATPase
MELININNNLVNKDVQFILIQKQLDAKRKLLLNKQQKLKRVLKQNTFLIDVKNDYAEYYSYIINQKKQQLNALEILNRYIDDLTQSGSLTEKNIEDAKYEQKKILKELKSIKSNLDELINFTEL